MLKALLITILVLPQLSATCGAATESLINIRPEAPSQARSGFYPGAIFELPNGRRITIQRSQINGEYITNTDIRISREGRILNGEFAGHSLELISAGFAPGATIALPDGSETRISEILADGRIRTENNLFLSSEGKILEGKFKGESARLLASGFIPGATITLPDGSQGKIKEIQPDGSIRLADGTLLASDGKILSGKFKGESASLAKPGGGQAKSGSAGKPGESEKAGAAKKPDGESAGKGEGKKPDSGPASKGAGNKPDGGKEAPEKAGAEKAQASEARNPIQIIMEDNLPSSPNPPLVASAGEGKAAGKGEGASKGESSGKSEGAGKAKGAAQGEGNGKGEGKAAGRGKASGEGRMQASAEGASAGKGEGKQPSKSESKASKSGRVAVGQEMRIPPEAAKTGNLDFLEGCWQGTRPEYFSKRIIRECFCFGANGKNGKRKVFDPQYAGMCIGATRARLSKSGVLSVTSSGAACTNGERWGQAEMECRNSGPRTPCSWLFRDARNGRQAYEIPFVRVESCER